MDAIQESRCAECCREFLHLGVGPPPSRCEDCVPETGPGSRVLEQIAINLRSLRTRAGLSREELAKRSAVAIVGITRIETERDSEPRVTTALRLSHAAGASLDQLAERIYWNPGEVAPSRGARRPPSERLAGFFSVPPANVPVFDPPHEQVPVGDRREAAAIVGGDIRAARERRHLTQTAVARRGGLSKAGLSLIERGVRETTIETLLSLAQALEVTPGYLLRGVSWTPRPACASRRHGRAKGHAGGSLDRAVTELWSEGRTAREIAARLGTSAGTVSAIVHRLRERGEPLAHRRPPTRAVDRSARARRATCSPAPLRQGRAPAIPHATPLGISGGEIAGRIGANVRNHRREVGLSQMQLAEAAEIDRTYVSRIERGRHLPSLSLVVKLAASLNVRCGRVSAGFVWDPRSRSFHHAAPPEEAGSGLGRLGENVRSARRRLGISQQALADRATTNRSEVGALERGSQNLRVFAVIRAAGALGIACTDLFTGVVDWYVRPLPPPECTPGDLPPTKAERDNELERLWWEGCSEPELAAALGLTRGALGAAVRDLRNSGRHLPYRRAPRSARERAARRRRSACALPADGPT